MPTTMPKNVSPICRVLYPFPPSDGPKITLNASLKRKLRPYKYPLYSEAKMTTGSVKRKRNGRVSAILKSSRTPRWRMCSGTSAPRPCLRSCFARLRRMMPWLVSPQVRRAMTMISQKPALTPRIAQITSLQGRYWATNAKRKYPKGLPHVAAQRNRLVAYPVWFQSSQEGLTAFSPLCVFIQSATTLLPLSKNTKHILYGDSGRGRWLFLRCWLRSRN